MSKAKARSDDPDMLAEYDFSGGERGKYAARYREGCNVVVLEPDVARAFPDSESVNQALRSLSEIIRQYGQNRGRREGGQKSRLPSAD